MRAVFFGILALGAIAVGATAAQAQFPDKQVTIVVPYPPGGATDANARTLAQKLSERWKQTVIVENKAGASGIVGQNHVARSAPDGYTLLLSNLGGLAVNRYLMKDIPYDPDKAFTPISIFAYYPYLLLAPAASPFSNVKDVLAAAKARPGKINFANAGVGQGSYLASTLMEDMAGVKFTHVAYKGGGPALQDTVGGHVDLFFDPILTTTALIKNGKLKALGITGPQRSPAMPDVPTIAESGLPGFDIVTWVALVAPYGTPEAVVSRISEAVQDILKMPDVNAALLNLGAYPGGGTPADLKRIIERDQDRYSKIIRARGVTAQ